MQEEIKFRVWDRQTKKMLYPTLVTIDSVNKQIHFPYLGTNHMFDLRDIQRYTGVKDKNGKEIYDGDILRVHRLKRPDLKEKVDYNVLPWPEDHWYDCVEIAWVHWCDMTCQYLQDYDYRRYDDIYPLDTGQDHRYEIVGNVVENPELLDGYVYNPARTI